MIKYRKKKKIETEADSLYNNVFRDKETLIEQKKVRVLVIVIIVLLLVILSLTAFFQSVKINSLEKNGVKTIAIVSGIKRNAYHFNDLEWIVVNNHIITYQYEVTGITITGMQTIENEDYQDYFPTGIEVNDTINIIYDQTNFKSNRIIR